MHSRDDFSLFLKTEIMVPTSPHIKKDTLRIKFGTMTPERHKGKPLHQFNDPIIETAVKDYEFFPKCLP